MADEQTTQLLVFLGLSVLLIVFRVIQTSWKLPIEVKIARNIANRRFPVIDGGEIVETLKNLASQEVKEDIVKTAMRHGVQVAADSALFIAAIKYAEGNAHIVRKENLGWYRAKIPHTREAALAFVPVIDAFINESSLSQSEGQELVDRCFANFESQWIEDARAYIPR